MKPYFLLFLFLFGFAGSLFAQRILVLDLTGMRSKRIKYSSGEYIYLKVYNDKTTFKGYVDIISDSSFFVNDNLVFIDSVNTVIRHHKAPKMISVQAFGVAGITAIISGLNNALTKGDVFPGDDSYFVPAVFAGIGAALLPFWRKKHKIGDKKMLKILDLTPISLEEAGG